jgi:parallel beta-helix repeat protein
MKIALAIIIHLLVEPIYAATITVGSNGRDYNSINAAIDAAKAGDSIEVQSGTYYETFDINKQITIQGIDTGNGKPIVEAVDTKNGDAVKLSADGIDFEGFEIINSNNGIFVISSNNTIMNNNLTNNYCAITLDGMPERRVENNMIKDNVISGNRMGITIYDGSNNNIIQNVIINNHNECSAEGEVSNSIFPSTKDGCSNGWGIYLGGSSGNTIEDNDIESNCFGISLFDSHNNKITSNYMHNNFGGIDFSYDRDSIHNNITKNQIIDDGGDLVGMYFNTADKSIAPHYEKIRMENSISNNEIKGTNPRPPCATFS